MKTIVLYASPLKGTTPGSISTKMTKAFLEEYKKNFAEAEILEIDLNKEDIGKEVLTSEIFETKDFFSNGLSDKYIGLLMKADHLIISTSMINFNVPAVLKNFIDHIAVAGKTFKYKYDGNGESEGLIKNLKVQILATQGAPKGWYPFGDHVAYLEGVFNFLGSDVKKPFLLAGTKTKEFNALSIDERIEEINEELKKQAAF